MVVLEMCKHYGNDTAVDQPDGCRVASQKEQGRKPPDMAKDHQRGNKKRAQEKIEPGTQAGVAIDIHAVPTHHSQPVADLYQVVPENQDHAHEQKGCQAPWEGSQIVVGNTQHGLETTGCSQAEAGEKVDLIEPELFDGKGVVQKWGQAKIGHQCWQQADA